MCTSYTSDLGKTLYLSAPQFFPLTVSDYLLGLSDLTGELMRFAISGLSSHKGGRAKAAQVCAFVRACKAGELNDHSLRRRIPLHNLNLRRICSLDFEQYTVFVPDLRKKQAVTAQSLEKIEDGSYMRS